jgi:hypothetical protein
VEPVQGDPVRETPKDGPMQVALMHVTMKGSVLGAPAQVTMKGVA